MKYLNFQVLSCQQRKYHLFHLPEHYPQGQNKLHLFHSYLQYQKLSLSPKCSRLFFSNQNYLLSNFHNLFAKKIPFLRKWNFLLILALSINFIPQIFFVWEQLRVAAKARTFTGNRYNFIGKIRTLVAQFSGVVSCMLQRSNEIRKIIISKS